MRLPNGLPEEVVRLTELDGYHDTTMHGFIEVIRPISSHDNQTIMSGEKIIGTWLTATQLRELCLQEHN